MNKQLMLIPLQAEAAAVRELSGEQREAIRSALAQAIVALVKSSATEDRADAK